MTHKANLGSQVFQEKVVIDGAHGPVRSSLKVKANQGDLAAGLIVAEDANKELIPYQSETKTLGTGNGTLKDFSAAATLKNLAPGSVTVSDGATTPKTVKDDGCGRLYGDGTGTVNYATGEISVTWTTAPANGNTVSAVVKNMPRGVNVDLVDTVNESAATVVMHGSVNRKALLVGANPAAAADVRLLEKIGVYPV